MTTVVEEYETGANAGEKYEILDNRGLELDRFHGGTAVPDDNGLSPKFLDRELMVAHTGNEGEEKEIGENGCTQW
ncbi:hypothetical protein V6N13_059972 [Hibiscus sabdariffa]